MIQRKEKYETPQFVFWLTEYGEQNPYPYNLILASSNVAPNLDKKELKGLADFIYDFLRETNNEV